jgi:hypothetical protein
MADFATLLSAFAAVAALIFSLWSYNSEKGTNPRKHFRDTHELFHHFQQHLQQYAQGDRTVVLKVFALDLEIFWSFYEKQILMRNKISNVTLNCIIVDVRSRSIRGRIDGRESSVRSSTLQDRIQRATEYLAANSDILEQRGMKVEIRRAKYPYSLQGIMIDNAFVYLGYVILEGGLLKSTFPFLYYKHNRSKAIRNLVFRNFSSWFEFYWDSGQAVCKN